MKPVKHMQTTQIVSQIIKIFNRTRVIDFSLLLLCFEFFVLCEELTMFKQLHTFPTDGVVGMVRFTFYFITLLIRVVTCKFARSYIRLDFCITSLETCQPCVSARKPDQFASKITAPNVKASSPALGKEFAIFSLQPKRAKVDAKRSQRQSGRKKET